MVIFSRIIDKYLISIVKIVINCRVLAVMTKFVCNLGFLGRLLPPPQDNISCSIFIYQGQINFIDMGQQLKLFKTKYIDYHLKVEMKAIFFL